MFRFRRPISAFEPKADIDRTCLDVRYYGYGYGPAYSYGYGSGYSYPAYTGYSYPAYGYGYGFGTSIVRRGLYAAAWRRWR